MATIGPYDQVSFANYTPMSSQEILMPALMMRERHDKLEEEYSQIDDELNKVAFIAETEDNPILKQRYSNYMNSLVQNRDKLMTQGITSNSRKDMLGLRSKFQSEIQPINLGYQMKLKDMEAFNQKKMQDSSFIGPDPSQRSVMDYINNGLQPFTMQGVSGNEIAKQTAEMAQQYSQLAKTREGRQLMADQFGFQYQEHWVDRGFIPGSPEAKQFEDHIKQSVLASNQINWANEEQMKLIDNSIQRGMSALIGKSDVNTLKDTGRDFRMQQALNAGQNGDPSFNFPSKDLGSIQKEVKNIDKSWVDKFNYDPSKGEFIPNDIKMNDKAKEISKKSSEYFNKNKEGILESANYYKQVYQLFGGDYEMSEDGQILIDDPGKFTGTHDQLQKIKNAGITANNPNHQGRWVMEDFKKRYSNALGINSEDSKKINNLYNNYRHLNKDPKTAIIMGLELEQSQKLLGNTVKSFNVPNDDFRQNLLEDIRVTYNDKSNKSGLFKINDNGEVSETPISLKDTNEIMNDKEASKQLYFGKNGVVYTDKEGNKYQVNSGDSNITTFNKSLKRSSEYLKDFSRKGVKNLYNINDVELSLDFLLSKGEDIVSNNDFAIKGISFTDGNDINKVIILHNKATNSIKTFQSSSKDEVNFGINTAKELDQLENMLASDIIKINFPNKKESGTFGSKENIRY